MVIEAKSINEVRRRNINEVLQKEKVNNLSEFSKNFALSVIYWVKNEDETYEVLDGQ